MDGTEDNRMCQAMGCSAKLSRASPYCFHRKLCTSHLKADCIQRKGHGDKLWRFCQQCGTLEPLQAFDGARRSCRAQLARRRAAAAAQNARSPRGATHHDTTDSGGRGPLCGQLGQPPSGQDRQALQARLAWLQQEHTLISQEVALLREQDPDAAQQADYLLASPAGSLDSTGVPGAALGFSGQAAGGTLAWHPALHGSDSCWGGRACVPAGALPALWSPLPGSRGGSMPGSQGGSMHGTHSMSPTLTEAASQQLLHQQLSTLFLAGTQGLPALGSDQADVADQLAAVAVSHGGFDRVAPAHSFDGTHRTPSPGERAHTSGTAWLGLQQGQQGPEPMVQEEREVQRQEDAFMGIESRDELEDMLEMALLEAGAEALAAQSPRMAAARCQTYDTRVGPHEST